MVGRSDLGCAEHAPLRIEPERGKIAENGVESHSKVPWHVLQDDDAGSHFAKDPGDIGPEVALILGTALPSGVAERLARVARRDEIHDAAPRAAIEGLEVVGNRRRIQGLVFHPRHETGRRIGLPLDVAHGSRGASAGEADAELQASDPGT